MKDHLADMASLAKSVDAEHVTLWRCDERIRALVPDSHVGLPGILHLRVRRLDKEPPIGTKLSLAVRAWIRGVPLSGSSDHEDYVAFDSKVCATASIPIQAHGNCLGVVTLEGHAQFDINALGRIIDDEMLVSLTSRLRQQSQSASAWLRSAYEVLSDYPDDATRILLENVRLQLPDWSVALYRRSMPESYLLSFSSERTIGSGLPTELHANEGPLGWAALSGQPLRLFNGNREDAAERDWFESRTGIAVQGAAPAGSLAVIPIGGGEDPSALLVFLSEKEVPEDGCSVALVQDELFETIGHSIASSIANGEAPEAISNHFVVTEEHWTIGELVRAFALHATTELGVEELHCYLLDPVEGNYVSASLGDEVPVQTLDRSETSELTHRVYGSNVQSRAARVTTEVFDDVRWLAERGYKRGDLLILPVCSPRAVHEPTLLCLILVYPRDDFLVEDVLAAMTATASQLRERIIALYLQARLQSRERELARWQRAAHAGAIALGVQHNSLKRLNDAEVVLKRLLADATVSQREPLRELVAELHSAFSVVAGRFRSIEGLVSGVHAPPEAVDANELAISAIREIRSLASLRNVTIQRDLLHGTLRVKVRSDALVAAIVNLLSNSIDARARKVTVRTSGPAGGSQDAKFVSIDVVDDGIGIQPEFRGRLFKPFVTRRTQAVGGTGLGLFTAKKSLDEMGGRIRLLSSEPGVRTAFRIEIPFVAKEGE